MFSFEDKIYPLTDAQLTGLSHAEQVAKLSDGGAGLIQLREKHLPPKEFYNQAEAALRVARKRGVRIIINDRVDLALALAADGVHLGQDDLPPEAARRLLGNRAIIGFSTHNLEQARRAADLPIDYLAIGPIFATSSKPNPDPIVGLEGLRKVRQTVGNFQLVAIGGITEENIRGVFEAGADAAAVITAILRQPTEIVERTKTFLSLR
ncbi:MAG: thiamine phosphate synthase [Pyrinomonadaceae bacterium]